MVCSIGNQTLLARTRTSDDLVMQEQQTQLEAKLDIVGRQIGKYANIVALLVVFFQVLFLIIRSLFADRSLDMTFLLSVGRIMIIGVCIIIVSFPEGLPLAVSVAMALSVQRLKDN